MGNDNFIKKVRASGESLYEISRKTGVPYTTLNRLSRNIQDVNKCSGDVLYRLSLHFSCTVEDLMNPVQFMTGTSGIYRGVKYKWQKTNEDKSALFISDGSKYIRIDKGNYYQKRFCKAYPAMGEALIDLYISRKEAEALLNG